MQRKPYRGSRKSRYTKAKAGGKSRGKHGGNYVDNQDKWTIRKKAQKDE
jgi:hypothetical protein